jgi:hypothetical protein
MNQKIKLALRSPLALLFLLWVAYLLLLGGLRRAGLDYGFKIGPQREDLNWMDFFLDASGGGVAQVFWKLDGRNPLSPWWYVLAEPLIRRSPYGLHVASMVINPFLACCTYLLLDRLGHGRSKAFAFTVALVVMLWTFTSSYSHIQWNFYGAAGFTLLSIHCYCGYIDGNRARGGGMVLALLCYLVAIGTYTLQTGAVVAVFFLALLRSDAAWPERIKRCVFDCGAFVALFLLFSLIWSASTTLPQSVFFSPDLPLFVGQAAQSLWIFITSPIISQHWQDTVNQWTTGNLLVVFIFAFLAIGAILLGVVRMVGPEDAAVPIGWALVVLVALSVPTLLLEATSTIWVPGKRSPMVQPVFQPLLWIGGVFAVFALLKRYALPDWLPFAASAAVAAGVLALALPYNQRLVQTTYHQLNLARQLKPLSANVPEGTTRYYVARVTSKGKFDAVQPLLAERNLGVYGRTMLGQKGLRLYILEDESSSCEPRIDYADEKVTIGLAQVRSDEVVTVFYDGKTITVPKKIEPVDLAGTCMTWSRRRPIEQGLGVAAPGG